MKNLSLIAILSILFMGCSGEPETKEEITTKENISGVEQQSEELLDLLRSQAKALHSLEERLNRLESSPGREKQTHSAQKDPTSRIEVEKPLEKAQDAIISYDRGAEIELDSGAMVSSPSGNMMSDETQEIIGGDLRVVSSKGATFGFTGGILEEREGRIIMTPIPGQRIRISSVEGKNKEQNHLVESTETSSATH